MYSDTDSIFVRSPVESTALSSLRESEVLAAQKGDVQAVEKLEQWNVAKQNMIDFGLEIAERYSKDSAVLEFEKGLSVFLAMAQKSAMWGKWFGPAKKCSSEGMNTENRFVQLSYFDHETNVQPCFGR